LLTNTAPETNEFSGMPTFVGRVKGNILKVVRKIFSQNRRNRNIKLENLLMCPKCKKSKFNDDDSSFLICVGCGTRYPIVEDGVVKFN